MNVNASCSKILLIGALTQVDLRGISTPLTVIGNAAEGIAALRKQPFDQVWICYDALPWPAEPALRGLRAAAGHSKLVVLAKMHQEPFVVQWLLSDQTGKLLDDYWICPLKAQPAAPRSEPDRQTDRADEDLLRQKDQRIAELEKLVVQDDLTGLKNRRYIRYFLPQVLAMAQQHHLQVSLLIFDIDNFKHYNDAYGHSTGDRVLQQAGQLFQRCCRANDVVARLGGDEFAVIFWDLPTEKHPRSDIAKRQDRRNANLEHPREPLFMTERFCRQLQEATFDMLGQKGKGALTISGGLATFPKDGATAEELFEKADRAMLEAKKSGKNRLYLVGQPAQKSP